MRRSLYLLPAVALVGGLTAALTVGAAVSDPSTAEAVATQYTVSRTVGPYNGALPFDTPGGVPNGEAPSVSCNNPHDALLGGNAVVNLKTSHGTSKSGTLNLDRIGAYWDSEVDRIKWGTFIRPTGKTGWNSVTITATCLVRK